MRKSILFFVPSIYPKHVGGLEIFYFYVLNNLSKDYNVILASSVNTNIENIEFVKLSSKIFLNFGGSRFKELSLFLCLLFYLLTRRKKIDLIHLPATSSSGFYGKLFPLISKYLKIPYIIVCHGGAMRPWKPKDGNLELYTNAKSIYGVSSYICDELTIRTNRRAELLLPMVPYFRSGMSKLALRIKYNIPTNSIVFLMVGSLKPLKGSKYVLNEFIKLDRDWIEQKNIRVLFVGNGADYIDMIDLTKSSRIADFIHFITFIRNEQISEVYELSDYFIMASDYEGTSKAMLEAMEKKLPIFATNVHGINNVLKHSFSAVLFQKNSGELANLIKTWLAKSDELSEFAEEAFKIYDRQYHFNLTVEHFKSIYGL